MRYIVITYETMKNFIALPPQKLFKIQQHIMISSPLYPPFAEKDWEWIRIGKIIMRKIMPVSRYVCISLVIFFFVIFMSRSFRTSIVFDIKCPKNFMSLQQL